MSEPGTRPGGLTALAVINFVFAAWGILVSAGAMLMPMLMPRIVEQAERDLQIEEENAAAASRRAASNVEAETREGLDTREAAASRARQNVEQIKEAQRVFDEHPDFIMVGGLVGLALALLLILAGIGYLKLRRFLGRTLGTLYAVGAIAWEVALVIFAKEYGGQQLGLQGMIGFIYPAITLFALHRVFKHDFVDP